MLKECSGPMNFTMFISKFAEKIGSADQDEVLINAFSMFDTDDTGSINCGVLKSLLTTNGERFTKEEVNFSFYLVYSIMQYACGSSFWYLNIF